MINTPKNDPVQFPNKINRKSAVISPIIMSIKFAKRFKHHQLEHCTNHGTPHYSVRPDSSVKLLRLSFKENKRDGDEANSSAAIKEVETVRQSKKGLSFYDFPTNISQFQEIHDDGGFFNLPSFNSLLSFENCATVKGQQDHHG